MGWYASLARKIGDQAWFRPIARNVLPRVDRVLGKVGWRATPWDTLILTTTGRSSGEPRESPLYYVEHAGGYAVVATNYGRTHDPDWSRNLDADQGCAVRIGRTGKACVARRATEEEWHPVFERFAAFYPSYRTYLGRANRDVPIWVLEPADAGAGGSG